MECGITETMANVSLKIFCQNEMSSTLFSSNVETISRIFPQFFTGYGGGYGGYGNGYRSYDRDYGYDEYDYGYKGGYEPEYKQDYGYKGGYEPEYKQDYGYKGGYEPEYKQDYGYKYEREYYWVESGSYYLKWAF